MNSDIWEMQNWFNGITDVGFSLADCYFIRMGSKSIQLSFWNIDGLKHVHYFHLQNRLLYSSSV